MEPAPLLKKNWEVAIPVTPRCLSVAHQGTGLRLLGKLFGRMAGLEMIGTASGCHGGWEACHLSCCGGAWVAVGLVR